ncbi:MAG: iron-containing alcohol dehydrogenase PsrA [Pseudomonadota bacterium]
MWSYVNPVRVVFGRGRYSELGALINGRRYGVVTYADAPFADLVAMLARLTGDPVAVIDDVAPNPDIELLESQAARMAPVAGELDIIVAIGGGSVIDTAKVLAASNGDLATVRRFLETKQGGDALSNIPIIAVPTTSGTGSEVTSWATVWDAKAGRKFSLARPGLYPETALIDPDLMLGKPRDLTLATGLDALSHALESLWNVNANPISANHAVAAARSILTHLPPLLDDLTNIGLRAEMAEAALHAGLAFSNTKTAIAHNISYPITLGWGVPHGIACAFTLPVVVRSVAGIGGFRAESLTAIFGPDLEAGADRLADFLTRLGVGLRFDDYGIPAQEHGRILDAAFAGERGRNFVGSPERLKAAAAQFGVVRRA